MLSANDISVLADLPSRDTLLAQFAGALSAPIQQLAGLIQALPRNLAYGLSALIDQRQASGEVPEACPGGRRPRRRPKPQHPKPQRPRPQHPKPQHPKPQHPKRDSGDPAEAEAPPAEPAATETPAAE